MDFLVNLEVPCKQTTPWQSSLHNNNNNNNQNNNNNNNSKK